MRQFLVILCLTALVWLGVLMSEHHDYPVDVRIEMTGYDTVRYARLQADTTLRLSVESNGFNALAFSLREEIPVVKIDMSGKGLYRAVAVADIYDVLRPQLKYTGVANITSQQDSLRLKLAERAHRTYRPSLDAVSFNFAEQYGLYGQPIVKPAEVTLYGPEETLSQIESLKASPTKVDHISSSGLYTIPLEPVWNIYPDVRPSATSVRVYLPVETFVERQLRLPVSVDNLDTTVRLRLYPEEVTVHVWVAQRDIDRLNASQMRVAVDYNDLLSAKDSRQPLRLTQFPEYVRPRGIEPADVQSVIIK